jgi:hypothetical protein
MSVRLEQVYLDEPAIRNVLEESAKASGTDLTEKAIQNALKAQEIGQMTAWLIVDDNKKAAVGMALTRVLYDDIDDFRTLFVYGALALEYIPIRKWDEAFEQMKTYARSIGCQTVTLYTVVERIKRLTARWGAKQTAFITMEV